MSTIVSQDTPPLDLRLATERPSAVDQNALALWFGLLGPSFLVLLNLELSYALTPWACRTGDRVIMIGATALIFVVDLLAGAGAARHLRHEWIEDTVITRPAFTAMLGILLSALGAVVIIAQWMPTLYLWTCQ